MKLGFVKRWVTQQMISHTITHAINWFMYKVVHNLFRKTMILTSTQNPQWFMKSINSLIVLVKEITLLQFWVEVCCYLKLSPQRGCLRVWALSASLQCRRCESGRERVCRIAANVGRPDVSGCLCCRWGERNGFMGQSVACVMALRDSQLPVWWVYGTVICLCDESMGQSFACVMGLWDSQLPLWWVYGTVSCVCDGCMGQSVVSVMGVWDSQLPGGWVCGTVSCGMTAIISNCYV